MYQSAELLISPCVRKARKAIAAADANAATARPFSVLVCASCITHLFTYDRSLKELVWLTVGQSNDIALAESRSTHNGSRLHGIAARLA